MITLNPEVKFLIQTKNNLIKEYNDLLRKEVKKITSEYYVIISELLLKQSSGGNLKKGFTYLSVLNKVESELKKLLENDSIKAIFRNLKKLLNNIFEITKKIHKKLSAIDISIIKHNKVRDVLHEQFITDVYSNSFLVITKPLKEYLLNSILSGSNITIVLNYIKNLIYGKIPIYSIDKYIISSILDTINGYDGIINFEVAKKFNMDGFLYISDSEATTNRPQCKRWENKGIILFSELSDELAWANTKGKGLKVGTNIDNFMVNRGGWGCKHQVISVRSKNFE